MKSVTFEVNHLKMDRGLYHAKTDITDTVATLTFDIRLCAPYTDEPLSVEALHTFEHVFATALRSIEDKVKTIYFGPMGCQTGFYAVFQVSSKDFEPSDAIFACVDKLAKANGIAFSMTSVPAKNEFQCGNFHTLGEMWVSREISIRLQSILDKVLAANRLDEYQYINDEDRELINGANKRVRKVLVVDLR